MEPRKPAPNSVLHCMSPNEKGGMYHTCIKAYIVSSWQFSLKLLTGRFFGSLKNNEFWSNIRNPLLDFEDTKKGCNLMFGPKVPYIEWKRFLSTTNLVWAKKYLVYLLLSYIIHRTHKGKILNYGAYPCRISRIMIWRHLTSLPGAEMVRGYPQRFKIFGVRVPEPWNTFQTNRCLLLLTAHYICIK
jgi:hypothetical protein